MNNYVIMYLIIAFLLAIQDLCILDKFVVCGSPPVYQIGFILAKEKNNSLLPGISPNSVPQPLVSLLTPSPLSPFINNNSTPKLSFVVTFTYKN